MASPSLFGTQLRLEAELYAEPPLRRRLNQKSRAPEEVADGRNASDAAIDQGGLVQRKRTLRVGNVEPVGRQADFPLFAKLNRMIKPEVHVESGGRTVCSDAIHDVRESSLGSGYERDGCCAARNAKPFIVPVNRMRDQFVEWRTRLNGEVAGDHQFNGCLVGVVELELMWPIVRQTSIGIAQQAHQVKQRCDVGIGLAIVVAEQPFVIPDQAGIGVRSKPERVAEGAIV
jgi:hypothetical protein